MKAMQWSNARMVHCTFSLFLETLCGRLKGFWGLSLNDRTILCIPSDLIGLDSLNQIRQSFHYDARLTKDFSASVSSTIGTGTVERR